MTHLIDKSALVAEIENMLNTKEHTSHSDEVAFNSGRWKALKKVKDILDTLEVKKVDLEKEIEFEYNPINGLSFEEFERIAKHFFEFGIKVAERRNNYEN